MENLKKKLVTNQLIKNRITIIVIFAMSIIPFAVAWYLAKHPDSLHLGVSNGQLITPPIETQLSEYIGYDSFSAENLKELHGHWVLVNLVPQVCNDACNDSIYKAHQISLMLGKDISRIRRAAVVMQSTDNGVFKAEWEQDGRLLKTRASATLLQKLTNLSAGATSSGDLYLMDPLGNLMMHYPAGYDPYLVRNDLTKLLKISQIG